MDIMPTENSPHEAESISYVDGSNNGSLKDIGSRPQLQHIHEVSRPSWRTRLVGGSQAARKQEQNHIIGEHELKNDCKERFCLTCQTYTLT
jgi:hypothetical protein